LVLNVEICESRALELNPVIFLFGFDFLDFVTSIMNININFCLSCLHFEIARNGVTGSAVWQGFSFIYEILGYIRFEHPFLNAIEF
jgi:hypothetical protein